MTEEDQLRMKELRDDLGKVLNIAISIGVEMLQIEKADIKEFTYLKGKMFTDNDEGESEYFFSIIHSDGVKLKIPGRDV